MFVMYYNLFWIIVISIITISCVFIVYRQAIIIRRKPKNILGIISLIFSVYGFFIFLGGMWIEIYLYKLIPDSYKMPLGYIKGIAVDSEGNIFCGAPFFQRIQVYNKEGKFLFGKCINSDLSPFRIRINSNDNLEVATPRSRNGDGKLYAFDTKGNLLHVTSNVPQYYVQFGEKSEYYCYDTKHDVTYLTEPSLRPVFYGFRVVKKDSSGKETVVIKTSFCDRLFIGFIPSLTTVRL
jgi:hypothetical protein